jgi:Cof subfamily protein (haloacid dehalogenase superfamily)
MDFRNIIIYTDMDGTVLTDWNLGPVVPPRSMASIKRFIEKGGTFSIASGRQHLDILPFFQGLVPNAPLVQGNGTSLYDCQTEQVIFNLPLSRKYKEECIALCRANDWVWPVTGNAHTVMQVSMEDSRDEKNHSITGDSISIEEYLNGDYCKIVYVVESPDKIPALQALTKAFTTADQMQQTLSCPVFLECYSRQAGKGEGIRRAMEIAGMTDKTLVCIGDFYNDVSMLEIADIAACPDNAPDDIKAMCKIVTCNNNEGALADLIEILEKM